MPEAFVGPSSWFDIYFRVRFPIAAMRTIAEVQSTTFVRDLALLNLMLIENNSAINAGKTSCAVAPPSAAETFPLTFIPLAKPRHMLIRTRAAVPIRSIGPGLAATDGGISGGASIGY